MNSCTYCGRPIVYSADAGGLAPASDDPHYHQSCADLIDGVTHTEGLFSYTGTVAGLALTLERNRSSISYELSREAHQLQDLLNEQWPITAWQLITNV